MRDIYRPYSEPLVFILDFSYYELKKITQPRAEYLKSKTGKTAHITATEIQTHRHTRKQMHRLKKTKTWTNRHKHKETHRWLEPECKYIINTMKRRRLRLKKYD